MTIEIANINANALPLILAFLAGLSFGALYFVLLWQAAKGLAAHGPGRRFALQLAVRFGLVLAALWILFWMGGGATRIVAAALGFFSARLVATRVASLPGKGD